MTAAPSTISGVNKSAQPLSILIIDDDLDWQLITKDFLESSFENVEITDEFQIKEHLAENDIDVVVLDINLRKNIKDVLCEIRMFSPDSKIIGWTSLSYFDEEVENLLSRGISVVFKSDGQYNSLEKLRDTILGIFSE